MRVAVLTIPSYQQQRIYASLFAIAAAKANKRSTMATATTSSSGSNSGGAAFTTIKERITFEKDIKKSKFIAIAGPVSDETPPCRSFPRLFIYYSKKSLPPFYFSFLKKHIRE